MRIDRGAFDISTPAIRNGNSGRWKGENAEVDSVSRAELLVRQRKFAGLSQLCGALSWFSEGIFRYFFLYFHGPLCMRSIFYPTGWKIRNFA